MIHLKFQIIILCSILVPAWCFTSSQLHSIFISGNIKQYCDMKCGKENHTLCNYKYFLADDCESIEPIKVSKTFIANVLNGHNGMRNRFADAMQVSNMIKLSWDKELSRMARNWIKRCENYDVDPCTQFTDITQRYENIGQNTYFKKMKYLSHTFETEIIRTWYMEALSMDRPRISERRAYFDIRNNFTQMIYANSQRLGCAASLTNGGVRLVCNYYPAHTLIGSVYKEGKPCSACRIDYPLASEDFENLCTAESVRNNYSALLVMAMIVLLLLLTWQSFVDH